MIEDFYSELDFIWVPFYLVLIYFIGSKIQQNRIQTEPLYSYYSKGLLVKLFASLLVSIIFVYYYKGGDNIGYFVSSQYLAKMQLINPNVYFSVLFNERSHANLVVFFENDLCCPDYWKDSQSFTVVRICSLFVWLGANNFLTTSLLFAWLSYGGIFRLFLLMNKLFPGLEKKFAISILYMPSLIFWGSSILKDTITFSAVCWLTYAFYNVFISTNKPIRHLIILGLAVFTIVSIKAYIFVALLPGLVLWLSYNRILKIRSGIIRVIAGPAIIIGGIGAGLFTFSTFSSALGDYGSVDKALNKAVVTKNDLTREAYGVNSFDIGEIDGSIGSLLSKFPAAVMAGLFRPYLWDSTNPIMLLSAFENTFIFLLFVRVLLKNGPGFFFRILANPVLTLCFVFSIFFAFSLGITTANFGALVRYKIPAIPFFLSMLYILDAPKASLQPETLPREENEMV
jgi:hypothetical protein